MHHDSFYPVLFPNMFFRRQLLRLLFFWSAMNLSSDKNIFGHYRIPLSEKNATNPTNTNTAYPPPHTHTQDTFRKGFPQEKYQNHTYIVYHVHTIHVPFNRHQFSLKSVAREATQPDVLQHVIVKFPHPTCHLTHSQHYTSNPPPSQKNTPETPENNVNLQVETCPLLLPSSTLSRSTSSLHE